MQLRRHRVERRIAMHDVVNRVGVLLRAERARAGEQLVQHRTEREDIRAMIDALPFDLFRRHVRSRADARSRRGDARRRDTFRPLGQLRHAKVDDLRAPVARDHHVVGLQIAMHDPRVMRLRQPFGDLRHHLDALRECMSLAHPLGERHAVDELHGEKVHIAVIARVVHRDDRWMIERR